MSYRVACRFVSRIATRDLWRSMRRCALTRCRRVAGDMSIRVTNQHARWMEIERPNSPVVALSVLLWDPVQVRMEDDMDEKAKPRRRRSQPRRDPEDAVPLDELLVVHCRNAVNDLPRGVLGTSTAADLLRVLPEASRLGLPDITGYGSEVFAPLVERGLLPACPSARVMPAALALAARVSPLIEARSARTWTLWLARVRAPGSVVARAVFAVTPSTDVAVVPVTPAPQAPHAAASPDEQASRSELAEIRLLLGIPITDDRSLVEILKPTVEKMFTIVQEAIATEEELASLQQRLEVAERDLEFARGVLARLGIDLADLMPPVTPSAAHEDPPHAPSIEAPGEGRYYRRVVRTDGQPTYYQRLYSSLPPDEAPSRFPGFKPRDKG